MDLIQILVLGLVQAITEWVPLSSKTIDAVIYTKFFGGAPENVIPMLLFLHLGTLIAATIYFRKEIADIARKFLQAPTDARRHASGKVGFLAAALFCTALVGVPILLLLRFVLPSIDGSTLLVLMGAGLVLTGYLLSSQQKRRWRNFESASWQDGVLTGLMQGFSTIPGVSRAGSTTTALIWRGFDSESAFHLSFLLSIPTVFLAEVALWAVQGGVAGISWMDGIALAASSCFFGYLTIGFLIRAAHRINVAWLAFAFGLMMIAFGVLGIG